MDTKSRKSRPFLAFLCFFLGLNFVFASAAISLNTMLVEGRQISSVLDCFQEDYQNTADFRQTMSNQMYKAIYIAVYSEEQSAENDTPDWLKEAADSIASALPWVSARALGQMLGVGDAAAAEEGWGSTYVYTSDSMEDSPNLLYYITYDGKKVASSSESEFSLKDGVPDFPPEYTFLMSFDGQKATAQKDGVPVDLYGSGYYTAESQWWVPGYAHGDPPEYQEFPAERLEKCQVWLAARGELLNVWYDSLMGIQNNQRVYRGMVLGVAGLGILGLLLCLAATLCRRSRKLFWQKAAQATGVLWFEWKLLLAALAVLATLLFLPRLRFWTLPILFWILLFFCNDLRHNRGEWRHNGFVWLWGRILRWRSRLPFQKRLLLRGPVLLLAAVLLGFLGLFFTAAFGFPGGTPAVFLLLAAVWLFFWVKSRKMYCAAVEDMGTLMRQLEAVKQGRAAAPLRFAPGSDLAPAAESLNSIQEGIRAAVEEQVKSERMKIELITNVSHDLKTPLTSIVSYVELLREEEGLPEHVQDYIRILAQKTDRLKAMVQDVFEVSKAASGSIALQLEPLDLGKLVRQTMADMEEKVAASGLLFRVSLSPEPAYIYADGQRLYRVFQNLIQNVLCYALEGTRVYLTQRTDFDRTEITVKNISRDELPAGLDLTERFARGDGSRTDGGSGLGLSIAKGFTEACGGSFRIELDGDLFTAVVSFPLFRFPAGRAPAPDGVQAQEDGRREASAAPAPPFPEGEQAPPEDGPQKPGGEAEPPAVPENEPDPES